MKRGCGTLFWLQVPCRHRCLPSPMAPCLPRVSSVTVSQLLHGSGGLGPANGGSVNDMVAVTDLAVTGAERVEVTAKGTAREVWILLNHMGPNQTQKRPKPLFFSGLFSLHRTT